MNIDLENLLPGENKIMLAGEAGEIEAILHLPKGEVSEAQLKAMMICCHPHPLFSGTMTNKIVHIVCKTFSRLGLPCLRFNFRGIGKSQGKHDNGIGESKDLLILCDMMKEVWPERELWLAGFSFGSWVAAHSAVEAGASQLLSIAPPVHHFDFEQFSFPECPWLVLMGEEDEVVEPEKVYQWVDSRINNRPELIKFAGATHFFHGQMVIMSNILAEHYRSILLGK